MLLAGCGIEGNTSEFPDNTPAQPTQPTPQQPPTSPGEMNPTTPPQQPSEPTGMNFMDPSIQSILSLPETPFDYRTLPDGFNAAARQDNTPGDNPITDEGASLGRVLFYDLSLSQNRTKACASCHDAQFAFTDPDRFSEGFEGGRTGRNSMSLMNLRFYDRGNMFWDERAASLEEQVLMPIQDAVEMGMDLDTLVQRLSQTEHYPILFELAFGDPAISSDRISLALAQFVRSIVSIGSRYDEGLRAAGNNPQAQFVSFTAEENQGKQIFLARGCAACHLPRGQGATIFFMDRPRNNGLTDGTEADPDIGLGEVTGRPQDRGAFKSSSLRNIALTAPYMHDGSLATLRDVIEHYNSGVENHPNLDQRLRQGPQGQPRRMNLSETEKRALEAFLNTLTDRASLSHEKHANPFRDTTP